MTFDNQNVHLYSISSHHRIIIQANYQYSHFCALVLSSLYFALSNALAAFACWISASEPYKRKHTQFKWIMRGIYDLSTERKKHLKLSEDYILWIKHQVLCVFVKICPFRSSSKQKNCIIFSCKIYFSSFFVHTGWTKLSKCTN